MANGTLAGMAGRGLRTPFVRVDGALGARDPLALSVPVAQAMASR